MNTLIPPPEAAGPDSSRPPRSTSPAALSGRVGVSIEFAWTTGPRDEVDGAVRWLVSQHAAGTSWRDCALVVPGKRKWREPVIAALDRERVPHRLLIGHPGARPDTRDDVLHAMSLYTAAESASRIVAVVGLGDLPWKQQPLDEAWQAVAAVVASTGGAVRLSSSKRSALTERVVAALPPARDEPG